MSQPMPSTDPKASCDATAAVAGGGAQHPALAEGAKVIDVERNATPGVEHRGVEVRDAGQGFRGRERWLLFCRAHEMHAAFGSRHDARMSARSAYAWCPACGALKQAADAAGEAARAADLERFRRIEAELIERTDGYLRRATFDGAPPALRERLVREANAVRDQVTVSHPRSGHRLTSLTRFDGPREAVLAVVAARLACATSTQCYEHMLPELGSVEVDEDDRLVLIVSRWHYAGD